MPANGEHTARRVPVLMYHSLDRSGSVISMPPDTFRRQIESLAERGFSGITLSELLDGWEGLRPLPSRPVVITFDDGLASVLQLGLPILESVGFRATVFAVAGYCGQSNRWPGQPPEIPRMPVLPWSGLRQLLAADCEIGAHSMTHSLLTALDPREAENEIVDSKHMLEDRLGVEVGTFAYPYGASSPSHHAVVSRHFRAACGTRLRAAHRRDDRADLPRMDAYYFRGPGLSQWIGTAAGNLYVRARRTAREWLRESDHRRAGGLRADSPAIHTDRGQPVAELARRGA